MCVHVGDPVLLLCPREKDTWARGKGRRPSEPEGAGLRLQTVLLETGRGLRSGPTSEWRREGDRGEHTRGRMSLCKPIREELLFAGEEAEEEAEHGDRIAKSGGKRKVLGAGRISPRLYKQAGLGG